MTTQTTMTPPKGAHVGRKRTRPKFKPDTVRKKLCLRLHELAGDLTNAEIAERLGLTTDAVSKWFQGDTSPDMDLLPKLAAMLGFDDYRKLLPPS